MKLGKKKMLLVSFILFSLFFGAGNLIFPPFLGQNAGTHTLFAIIGFLATAVVLPILSVIVVTQFDGLVCLSQKVGARFGLFFTALICISIGPGLGIPRAASVPFEMAVAPYLPAGTHLRGWLAVYSLAFFVVALWLCLNPGKLVQRIGTFMTPSLLLLLCLVFVTFLFRGESQVIAPQPAYQRAPFLEGFVNGYQTMDTIAGLNFGMMMVTTLGAFGIEEKKNIMRHTIWAGICAGSILVVVYMMLTYMGMCSSGVYPIQGNGAWTLRCIVYQLFGGPGAILLAVIFTLACLTACVGLINSISQYLVTLFRGTVYWQWVCAIIGCSFLICNLGLDAILHISIPILNAIYPVCIVLILLGLSDSFWKSNGYVYPFVVLGTGLASVVYVMDTAGLALGAVGSLCGRLPLYTQGFGWVSVALVMWGLSLLANRLASQRG